MLCEKYSYVQQDKETAHTSQYPMDALHEMFVLWPPHLPDLSVCDFYMLRNLKQKVYCNNPHTLMALKYKISSVIHNITYGELQEV